jgi:hypothetical protein
LWCEDWGESFDGEEKVFAGGAPTTVISETTAGDDVMNVRMKEEVAGPGVEYADHAQTSSDEPWVMGQLVQGCGGSAKEQVVDQLSMTASQGPQLSW